MIDTLLAERSYEFIQIEHLDNHYWALESRSRSIKGLAPYLQVIISERAFTAAQLNQLYQQAQDRGESPELLTGIQDIISKRERMLANREYAFFWSTTGGLFVGEWSNHEEGKTFLEFTVHSHPTWEMENLIEIAKQQKEEWLIINHMQRRYADRLVDNIRIKSK